VGESPGEIRLLRVMGVRMHAVVGLVIVGIILCGCSHKRGTPQAEEETVEETPEIEGFKIVETVEGQPTRSLEAEEILSTEGDLVNLRKVKLIYYREGNPEIVLTAEKGLYNQRTKDFKAMENVVVKRSTGEVLYTKELLWHAQSETISAPGKIKIEAPRGTLYGNNLECDTRFNEARLSDVNGVIILARKEGR